MQLYFRFKNLIYFYGFVILLSIRTVETGGCSKITMSGSSAQEERMGIYKKMSRDRWCDDRPSYKQTEGGNNYLFYLVLPEGYRAWLIGTTLCENLAGLSVQDDAKYPEKIKRKWSELQHGFWVTNRQVAATCDEGLLGVAEIIGIALASTVVLGFALFALICFLQHRAKANSELEIPGYAGANNQTRVWSIRPQRAVHPIAPPSYGSHVNDSSHSPTNTSSMAATQRPLPHEPAPAYRSPTPGSTLVHNVNNTTRMHTHYNSSGRNPFMAAVEYNQINHPMSPPPAYEDIMPPVSSQRTHTGSHQDSQC